MRFIAPFLILIVVKLRELPLTSLVGLGVRNELFLDSKADDLNGVEVIGFVSDQQDKQLSYRGNGVMARIRYVKPEFFSDTTLAEVSIQARLLYIGLFCQLDRNGVGEDNAKLLKREVFPYDDGVSTMLVNNLLNELVSVGRVFRFEYENKKLLYCPTFYKHQNFHRDERPKYPLKQETILALCQHNAETVQASFQTPASTTGTGTETGIETETETGTQPPVATVVREGVGFGLALPNGESVSHEQIEKCVEVWLDTLHALGSPRDKILAHEGPLIFHGIKQCGFVQAAHALYGMRFEPRSSTFDPAKRIDIARAFKSHLHGGFVDLALAHKAKEKEKQDRLERQERERIHRERRDFKSPDEDDELDAAEAG